MTEGEAGSGHAHGGEDADPVARPSGSDSVSGPGGADAEEAPGALGPPPARNSPDAPAAEHAPAKGRGRDWWLDRLAGVTWVGLGFLWVVVAVWVLRLAESTDIVWLLTSGLHLLLLCGWIALAVGLLLRRRAMVAAAAATVVLQLVVAWPLMPWRHGTSPRGRAASVGSVNLYADNDQLDAAARTIAGDLPAVLTVQEYTPRARAAFARAGIIDHYRYKVEHPDPATTGLAVYSRYPIRELPTPDDDRDVLLVELRLPGRRHVRLLDLHAFPPQPGDAGAWQRDMQGVGRILDHLPEPWMAIGDFNATSDHRLFRDLLRDGRRDAHQLTGRGYARSWPSDTPFPAMVLIDHAILSSDAGASGTRERTIPGTDHRMIVVDLTV